MDEVVRTITLTGFEPEGEPQVRVMDDGSLLVVFNFMPPPSPQAVPTATRRKRWRRATRPAVKSSFVAPASQIQL
jgi:hypothetical protein